MFSLIISINSYIHKLHFCYQSVNLAKGNLFWFVVFGYVVNWFCLKKPKKKTSLEGYKEFDQSYRSYQTSFANIDSFRLIFSNWDEYRFRFFFGGKFQFALILGFFYACKVDFGFACRVGADLVGNVLVDILYRFA